VNIDDAFKAVADAWETRDACATHYPRPCPSECPNAPKPVVGVLPVEDDEQDDQRLTWRTV
jgi:hypothetical protein